MLNSNSEVFNLSKLYNIPPDDITFIGLNSLGIKSNKIEYDRVRFRLKLDSFPEEFYLGLPVNKTNTPFKVSYNGYGLFLNETHIGNIMNIENDTCDSTYFRRNKTAMTLNSNSRSLCKGCKFCGTYNQKSTDFKNLLEKNVLRKYLDMIVKENDFYDFSSLNEVAVCTGCFPNEEQLVKHLVMIKECLNELKFGGELKYIGSQITSKKSLDTIKETIDKFSLYLTVECFTRRENLMKPLKYKVSIEQGKEILKDAMDRGFDTNILYVLGLDPLEVLYEEFKDYTKYLTRFPIINIFQPYTHHQLLLKNKEAHHMKYYLKARKLLESIFEYSELRPKPWENYRSLWYTKFAKENIHEIKI